MKKGDLSSKLKYILKELNINKTEFLERCRTFSPSISKPTVLNAINGKNTTLPTIDTLSTIIKVCQTSGKESLKYISYDFLLNDTIEDVKANNASVYQEVGLTDVVIKRLKLYNMPNIYEYMDIINYFFVHTPVKYWKYLSMLKRTYDIKKNINNKQELLKLFDDGWYLLHLEDNFKNIYDIYLDIKNNKEVNYNKLNSLLDILIEHLIYTLNEKTRNLYENMKGR